MEAWRLEMEPCKVCIMPVVANSQHFDAEPNTDPRQCEWADSNSHKSEMSDPYPHQSERSDP